MSFTTSTNLLLPTDSKKLSKYIFENDMGEEIHESALSEEAD